MRNIFYLLIISLFFVIACVACGDKEYASPHGVNCMEDSELLAIYERDGYDEIFIANPKGEEIAHYILIKEEKDSSINYPEDAVKIIVPVKSLVLDSEVYAGALEELNSDDLISGIFDASYITSPKLKNKISEGNIKDLGQPSSPNIEQLMSLQPDAMLISYFEGMNAQGLDKTGTPILKMYDLQESSPLGRAEWIKLLGRLSGQEDKADSIYEKVKEEYNLLKQSNGTGNKPKILMEMVYEGSWNVAGGKSYQASLIKDAGGKYFKEDNPSVGSLFLAPEQVIIDGGDSEIWLIKFYGDRQTLKSILDSDPIYKDFTAYKNGNIYFSDTSKSGIFREFPFHPEKLLRDYVTIFSGDSISGLLYFERL